LPWPLSLRFSSPLVCAPLPLHPSRHRTGPSGSLSFNASFLTPRSLLPPPASPHRSRPARPHPSPSSAWRDLPDARSSCLQDSREPLIDRPRPPWAASSQP
jgi:hypothetical protein